MVHDRRVNGDTFVFGNQGGLFRNAMTWFDHETESVWSQVWGQSIAGPLKGTTLDLIPAAIVPWETWKTEHPNTVALINDKTGLFSRKERPRDGWVIGITIGEHQKAFYYKALTEVGVLNDFVGPYPVALYADAETRNVRAYLREVDDQVLTLALSEDGKQLIDDETGTKWSIAQGIGQSGEFEGKNLLLIPYLSSFDWAWLDFHPDSEFYE